MDKKKVLLVEDELFIRELYARTLSQAGFNVLTAIDGPEGLKFAKDHPDIMLLDIMLPKMHGLDVLKNLMADEDTKNTPVVLLSNLGQESIIKEALKLGAKGYLMKMRLTPYEIVAWVKEFLENPNAKVDINRLKLD